MKIRRIRLIKNKDGHGNMNYKISLPKTWINKLNNPEKVLIEFNNEKIIIKEDIDMILIKEKNVNNSIEYVLEDGTELYKMDWNGEIYINGFKNGKNTNCTYKPVYRFQSENINLDILEENSKEYDEATEIIGFN